MFKFTVKKSPSGVFSGKKYEKSWHTTNGLSIGEYENSSHNLKTAIKLEHPTPWRVRLQGQNPLKGLSLRQLLQLDIFLNKF